MTQFLEVKVEHALDVHGKCWSWHRLNCGVGA
jgi:hypothetical protein